MTKSTNFTVPDMVFIVFFDDGRTPMVIDATTEGTVEIPSDGVAVAYRRQHATPSLNELRNYGAGGGGAVVRDRTPENDR